MIDTNPGLKRAPIERFRRLPEYTPVSITGTVKLNSLLMKISAAMNSFQDMMKAKSAASDHAGQRQQQEARRGSAANCSRPSPRPPRFPEGCPRS